MALTLSMKRYAQALFEIAEQQSLVDECSTSLESLLEVLDNDEAYRILNHPKISLTDKVDFMSQIKPECNKYVFNFIGLLISRGLFQYLQVVVNEFFSLVDQKKGRHKIELIIANVLNENKIEQITSHLKKFINADIVLNKKIDEELIGGLILLIEDTMIDGSLKTKLTQLGTSLKT